jgi:hypothetical protein
MPPLYEYLCRNDHVTTILARVNYALDVHRCETCGGRAKKIISAPAPPVIGGMIYQPIPGDPRPKAEHKVDYKDWKRQDDAHKQRMLRNAGRA